MSYRILVGFFGLLFLGLWVFTCLMLLHMLPCDWYAAGCS